MQHSAQGSSGTPQNHGKRRKSAPRAQKHHISWEIIEILLNSSHPHILNLRSLSLRSSDPQILILRSLSLRSSDPHPQILILRPSASDPQPQILSLTSSDPQMLSLRSSPSDPHPQILTSSDPQPRILTSSEPHPQILILTSSDHQRSSDPEVPGCVSLTGISPIQSYVIEHYRMVEK